MNLFNRYFLVFYTSHTIIGNHKRQGDKCIVTKNRKFLNKAQVENDLRLDDAGQSIVMITQIMELSKKDYKEFNR